MTEEYAKLSLRAGLLAAAIEHQLGYGTVMADTRNMAWILTPQIVEGMKESAIKAGVPPQVLEEAEQDAAALIDDRSAFLQMVDLQTRIETL